MVVRANDCTKNISDSVFTPGDLIPIGSPLKTVDDDRKKQIDKLDARIIQTINATPSPNKSKKLSTVPS